MNVTIDVCYEDFNASIVSKLLQMQNDPLASLCAKQHATNYPTREEEDIEDEKLTKDMECALNDAVATAESGGKINCGAVLSTQKAQRKKKKVHKGKRQKGARETSRRYRLYLEGRHPCG